MAEDPPNERRQIRIRVDVEMLHRAPQSVTIPVAVDWPELGLSAEQLAQNAQAVARGLPEPHADPSRFDVVLEPTRDHPSWEPPDRPAWIDMEVVPTRLPLAPATPRRGRHRRWRRWWRRHHH